MDIATLNLNIADTQRQFLYRKGSSDEAVIVQILQNRAYDLGRLARGDELTALYEQLVQSGKEPLIVDAGANIGASAVYFSFSFSKARLVAIEPDRTNFDLLAANTADLPVECLHAAVAASSAGKVNVTDPGQGFWGYRTVPVGGATALNSVSCITINEIFERRAAAAVPFIVKIDIEGGESELFSANSEWIDQTPIIIIELHDWLLPKSANSRAFLQCIASRDRDFVYLDENIYSIANNITVNSIAA